MKRIIAVDNPINGYVEGHCDSEDLGIFKLSPEVIGFSNCAPRIKSVYLTFVLGNDFSPEFVDFYDKGK